jgi:hypothetical protein
MSAAYILSCNSSSDNDNLCEGEWSVQHISSHKLNKYMHGQVPTQTRNSIEWIQVYAYFRKEHVNHIAEIKI